MKLRDILKDTEHEIIQGENPDIRNITIDSRFVSRGELFFCIRGLHVDGHDFIEAAAKQGAAAVVTDRPLASYPEGLTVVKVDDTRLALAYAAASFFGNPAESFDIIGVTGTNGKTSVTHFLEAILTEWGRKNGIIGTVETRIGKEDVKIHFATSTTPDTIELQKIFLKMKDENVTHVAMEVTSHAIALRKTDGLKFKAGVFTNLTQDHLDFHGTMDEYKAVKARLFESCEYGVFNIDDPAGEYMMKHAAGKTLTYGIDGDCELKAVNLELLETGVAFDVLIAGQKERFSSRVPGRFTVYNMLGAIGAAAALNIPVPVIKAGLEGMSGVPGRIQRVPNDKGFGVIIDYAHTPDGLSNIALAVREFTKGRIITVFGCGGDRDKKKRPIMGEIAGRMSDYCVITSDNPRTEDPMEILNEIEPGVKEAGCPYEKIADRREAIFRAVAMAEHGDSILIAGKGHESYQIFADHTADFDDREVAEEAIAAL